MRSEQFDELVKGFFLLLKVGPLSFPPIDWMNVENKQMKGEGSLDDKMDCTRDL